MHETALVLAVPLIDRCREKPAFAARLPLDSQWFPFGVAGVLIAIADFVAACVRAEDAAACVRAEDVAACVRADAAVKRPPRPLPYGPAATMRT